MFEDVGWFGGETVPMEYTGHQPFLSNGVRVVHCAGTSFCHVHFYMEVTDLDGPSEWAESLRQIGIYAKGEKPGFSGKKLALSVFPKTQYRYCHTAGSCFEMVRRTPSGHRLTVTFDSAPPAYFWQSASIALSGLKFCCPLYREQICRENAETVRAFMEHCRRLAEQAEAALDRPLYDCFGASPDWWLAE